MAKKQAAADPPPESTGDDLKLVAKVDKMMATDNQDMTPDYEPKTKQEDAAAAPPKQKTAKKIDVSEAQPAIAAETVGTPPPLDIFADVPGAPPLDDKSSAKKTPPKKATKISVVEAEAKVTEAIEEAAETESTEPEPEEQETTDEPEERRAENFDDPVIAEAIEDIVAKEGDVVLSSEDQKKASSEVALPRKKSRHTHHLFWSLVALVCLLAIAMAVFIIDPAIHNPLRHVHWSSIRRHI